MRDYGPAKGLSAEELGARVERVLEDATLEEKVAMMSGRGFFQAFAEDGRVWGARPYRAGGGLERLGVPALWFTDGPRGVARGQSTCFPCSMARGASFDTALERRIGEAMGIEARAQGCNLSGAVCINLLRHPGWGRAQETYGEDPHHLGAMGAALGLGLQSHNVIATAKHFACNSIENSRFTIDVEIDERPLHEVYLPHFKMVLDAGIASVMSAYNKVNGRYCSESRHLLTDILRKEWGFAGFVHSDWVIGVHSPAAATAGLDIENPEPRVWGARLVAAVEAGDVAIEVIDNACRRILTTLYRFLAAEDPLPDYPETLVNGPAHRALALEAAESSAVLLANDGVLPLDASRIGRLALLGRLAGLVNTGDHGSSAVRARHVVTAREGLEAALGADRLLLADETDLEAAATAARAANAVVVVVGTTADEEGEYIPGDLTLDGGDAGGGTKSSRQARGGDRLDLGLPADQLALIEVAIASGRPVVVVIVSGSAILVEPFCERVSAILQTFYAGEQGGTALARLLFGEVSPSGRLPFTLARDPADYPFFDPFAERIRYDLWHGYPRFERDGRPVRYPFGHGLSYTRWETNDLRVERVDNDLRLGFRVTNAGSRRAATPVLAFVAPPGKAVERWPRALKAFTRVSLAPGETARVELAIPLDSLRWRCGATHSWRLEPGSYRIDVGTDGTTAASSTIEL